MNVIALNSVVIIVIVLIIGCDYVLWYGKRTKL
jgi:hypothetical protein